MMKYIYVISALMLTSFVSKAQIGVNTENLISGAIFQVDPLKNSTSVGGGVVDDMIVSADNSIVGLGLGAKVSGDAQLELNSQKKALKLNEVKLKSLTDIVTVPNPRAGMTVYNTVAVASEEVEVGWYYFDGVKWNRILQAQREPALKNEFSILFPANTADLAIPGISYSDAISGVYSGAVRMKFENSETSQIKAPTDGTYVFAVRLYLYVNIPMTTPITYNSQSVLYVFLVSKTQNKILEKALLTFPYTQNFTNYYAYRLVMGTQLDLNEEVDFYIARGQSPDFEDCLLNIRPLDSSTDPDLKSAARTSMVFWKL